MNQKKEYRPDMPCMELLFTERGEGYWQILLIATGRECSVWLVVQAQYVCVEAQKRSDVARSLERLPHHPKPEEPNVLRKPRWCEACCFFL